MPTTSQQQLCLTIKFCQKPTKSMSTNLSPTCPLTDSVSSLETVARTVLPSSVCQDNNGITPTSVTLQTVRPGVKEVPFTLDLNAWMTDNTTRYFLPQLFIASGSRLDKKITMNQHVSDAVVWNIVYIDRLTPFPTESPTPEMKNNALLFLIDFRRQLNAMFVEEIRTLYLNAANSQDWSKLRNGGDNFVSYKDLIERMAEETEEIVSYFCYGNLIQLHCVLNE